MTESLLPGTSIDHVELYVPDRPAAAAWYGRLFGLRPVEGWARWATETGPLMLTADDGRSMIALFIGTPCPSRERRSHPRVAFRTGAAEFVVFVGRAVADGPVFDPAGRPLGELAPIDHGGAFSVYFSDAWGHQLEVTTYDWREVARRAPEWLGASREMLGADAPGVPGPPDRASAAGHDAARERAGPRPA